MRKGLFFAAALLGAAILLSRLGVEEQTPEDSHTAAVASLADVTKDKTLASPSLKNPPSVTPTDEIDIDHPESPGHTRDCASNALRLSPPLTHAEEMQWSNDLNAKTHQVEAMLSTSGGHEHLHVRALMTWNKSERMDLLKESLQQDPNNVMTLWHALRSCSELKDKGDCPLREWEHQLSSLAADNGQVWMRIALNRFEDNQPDEALAALKRAGAARESTVYWRERTDLYLSTLGSTGLLTHVEEHLLAFGSSEARLPEHAKYTDMCARQAALSSEWAEACLAYASSAVNHALPMDALKAAHQIQYQMLETLERGDNAAEVFEQFNERIETIANHVADSEQIGNLLLANPELMVTFFETFREQGELLGFENMYAELKEATHINDSGDCVNLLDELNNLE